MRVDSTGEENIVGEEVSAPPSPDAPQLYSVTASEPVNGPEPDATPSMELFSPPLHHAPVTTPLSPLNPRPHVLKRIGSGIAESWLWRSRGLWLGAMGLGFALYGQKLVTVDRQIVPSIRWYALGIFVMFIAWLGTYKNKSGLVVPLKRQELTTTLPTRSGSRRAGASNATTHQRGSFWSRLLPRRASTRDRGEPGPIRQRWRALTTRFPFITAPWPRYLLAAIALSLNLWSANAIRQDYFSVAAGWGWFGSLALLVLAFVGEKRKEVRDLDADNEDIEERTDLRFSRKTEFLLVAGIIAIALVFRFYRLGDWFTGMHGDEGEAGMDAINIMEGGRVSLFQTGWFAQPNFYYYGIARVMDVFGTDLFGLRMFALLVGSAMLVPFYLLVRLWFGVRAALIALTLLSISAVAVHFTKVEFSNIAWPAALIFGFYFLARGFKTKRALDFIFSAYSFMIGSLHFYNGGRLTPFLLIGVFGYILLLAPALRLPAAYGEIRRLMPDRGRLRALGGAFRKQALSVLHYFPQLLVFLVAMVCSASAFGVYYLDYKETLDARARDKIIFNNEPLMARYGRTHQPLYVGLRWPNDNDIYPFSPVVFEQTPLSVKVADDGYWPRVLWDQTTTTLSILTYEFDRSSVYTFTGDPVAKPIEAALIILGIAWTVLRWRDTRMAMLSMWFWSAVIAGGVLTIDAPYMARLSGAIPVLAIFAAIPLNKLAAELTGALAGFRFRLPSVRWRRVAGQTLGVLGALALLVYLGLQNWNDYYGRYLAQSPLPFPEVTGQSYFVRQMNQAELATGRPKPKYYNLGAHFIYWSHGDNRFLNHGTDGIDMVNPSNELPVFDAGDRDVIFIVWGVNQHYLNTIKAYYPEGKQAEFLYGPQGKATFLFTYYRVTREQLAARRVSLATYKPPTGPSIMRDEPGLGGTTIEPPRGLAYPAQAKWETNLVAPAFGRYRLSLDAPGEGKLLVNEQQVITTTAEAQHGEIELLLARGPHAIRVEGALQSPQSKVSVRWATGPGEFQPVPSRYVWNGGGRAFYGTIGPFTGQPLNQPLQPGSEEAAILAARVDGFIGFRDAGNALGVTGEARWVGNIEVKQPGIYTFDMMTSGPAAIFVDGKLASSVEGSSGMNPGTSPPGSVDLSVGPHTIEVRASVGGSPYLEVFWAQPGGGRTMLGVAAPGTTEIVALGGIVDPARAAEPPPVQLQPEAPPKARRPQALLGGSGKLNNPRGLAVDSRGYAFVGDRGNGRVVSYAPDGSEARTWGKRAPEGSQSPGPGEFVEFSDLAVGADGTVYVMDIGAAKLHAFTPDGELKWALDNTVLQAGSPNGIGVAPDGSIYIAATSQDRIIKLPPTADGKIGPESVASIDGGAEFGRLQQPVDVAADPSDPTRIYALDLRNRVAQLDASGKIVKQWSMQIGLDDGAGRIAVSGDGSLIYVSDPDRHRVAVLTVGDGSVSYFGGTGSDEGQFLGLSGIAVGPSGKVYLLDRRNNRVQVFEP